MRARHPDHDPGPDPGLQPPTIKPDASRPRAARFEASYEILLGKLPYSGNRPKPLGVCDPRDDTRH